jgi:hypothetical protein
MGFPPEVYVKVEGEFWRGAKNGLRVFNELLAQVDEWRWRKRKRQLFTGQKSI